MALERRYEEQRLGLQQRLDAGKTRAERNRLGQFATPTGLALDILAYAKTLLPAAIPVRFLDPAFGTGAFYSALLQVFPDDAVAAAAGFEIDAHYARPALALWGASPLQLMLDDFTRAEPPPSDADRFNLIVCNPPYVRHHHLPNGEKRRLQDLTNRACGVQVSGLAGLYCYFLCLAHTWLAADGVACWLIPSEFMDVNYGQAVKKYLLDEVTLLRIHRFDPAEVQFDDALVSSAVVAFRKAKPAADHQVEFTFGGTLLVPKTARLVPATALRDTAKWTRYPLAGEPVPAAGAILGDFFTIRRGLATGDNKFFVLTRRQVEDYGLPLQFFRPILPSPRYLRVSEIAADADGNPALEPQLFLLDCSLPEAEIRTGYPTLWSYLQIGRLRGVDRRYLCRHRSPWYAQERRPAAPFLCTYMGRGNGKRESPFRFILNHSQATATNVYLLMYPKPALAHHLQTRPGLFQEVWQALNQISVGFLLREGRIYGGGLHKLEPRELTRVSAAAIAELLR